jgi:hypothetical protein
MSPDDFRKLALRLPEVVEQQHQGHPDFRICGKVFATLKTCRQESDAQAQLQGF